MPKKVSNEGSELIASIEDKIFEEKFVWFLSELDQEIAKLPIASVPLVGGLVAMQESVPKWLSEILHAKLCTRVRIYDVSPAAEAVMRLAAFSVYKDQVFASFEIEKQLALLRAVELDDKVKVAAKFVSRVASLLEVFVSDLG